MTPISDLNNSHAMMYELAKTGESILELGCGPGVMTQEFVSNNNHVVGVEIDADLAATARSCGADIYVANLETTTVDAIVGSETFDVVVMGDVLEHLRNPRQTLVSATKCLNPGGRIVASIPNVAHGDVRMMLLGGRWVYSDLGLLDRTHVHLFCEDTIFTLFGECDLSIRELYTTNRGLFDTELNVDSTSVAASVVDSLAQDSRTTIYQYIVVATVGTEHVAKPHRDVTPEVPSDRVSRLTTENQALRERVDQLGQDAERGVTAKRELDALRASRTFRVANKLRSLVGRLAHRS